ncbi:uncharacterized protein G2W53_002679 [Senna tora]|uniref:Uncharacterized protein n=1 Tax=Senna tora TaxID=362788 RepID=A0A834X8I7_9FABA|nr:uncharacterized protein G2W53_002679 [Senna tora]
MAARVKDEFGQSVITLKNLADTFE